ncbi:phage holin, LLH family [Furfurilactobacillus cerevisiae]|uniref:phage holin, LLH family n=1 Tax=Furfurilactobacillus rossiae TaxID=231049 RepID=UPI003B97F29F
MNSNFWNDLVTLGVVTGLFSWLYFGLLSPAVHQWIATQNASKAKQVEELLITLADTAVRGLSVNLAATGADKKAEAVKRVNSALLAKGINVDTQRIADTVERSFQGFAQTNAPALANAQSAYEQQSTVAASQMAAAQSGDVSVAESVATSAPAELNPNNVGSNVSQAPVSPLTSNAPESGATTNGQSVQ